MDGKELVICGKIMIGIKQGIGWQQIDGVDCDRDVQVQVTESRYMPQREI